MFIARPLKGVSRSVLEISPIRSLSTTASFAARPRSRPAPKKGPVSTSLLQGASVDEQLPPMALLKPAKKSGALDVEPDRVQSVLRDYIAAHDQRKPGTWEKQFWAEEKITPKTVSLLALILIRCKEQPRMRLGLDLLLSASAMGEPSATIYVLTLGLTRKDLSNPMFAAPLAQLRRLAAPPHSNIQAMVLLGQICESQGDEVTALHLYQQVASTPPPREANATDDRLPMPTEGVSSALIRKGLILQRGHDLAGAISAFRKAALDHDDPSAYYYLTLALAPSSSRSPATTTTQETYLLKAASSGIIEAATALGALYATRAKISPSPAGGKHGREREQKQEQDDQKLAKEWLFLGATDGDAVSMLYLAEMFAAEGRSQAALKWVAMAEKSSDTDVREKAKGVRASVGVERGAAGAGAGAGAG